MRARFIIIFAIILLCGLIFSLPKLVVSPILERSLENYAKNEFVAAEVFVNNSWGWDVVFGRARIVELVIKDGVISGLPIETLTLNGYDVRFDAWALLRDKQFRYFGSENLWVEARVSELALNEYFQQEIAVVDDLVLHLIDDVVVLQGKMDVLNIPLTVRLEGELIIVDQTVLRLVPEHIAVEEAAIPPFMLSTLNDYFTIGVNFDVLPFPIEIADVQIVDGAILIRVQEVER